MITDAAFAAAAFGLTYALVPLVRRAAERFGVIDYPNARSSHARPVPRGGGVAIVAVSMALLAFAAMRSDGVRTDAFVLLAGAAAIAALGLLDDVRSINAVARLAAQLVIATLVVVRLGVDQLLIPLEATSDLTLAALHMLAVLWIVGMINAYNFMDGIDGLAGLQGVIAAAGFGLAAYLVYGVSGPLAASGIVAGACGGFLLHNWPPARIFMGDVASGYLGYVFATLPLWGAGGSFALRLVGVYVMWPFLFDTLFTFGRRLSRGENVLQAHRTHLYQRLVQTGLSHAQVTLLYAAQSVSAVVASGAMLWQNMPLWTPAIVLAIGSLLSWQLVRVRERRPSRATPNVVL